ncbi:MAG: c-type cytochrome [Acidobacteriota bacterium]|nr:c-type cytochrome [Acidobacteriota bacterium]
MMEPTSAARHKFTGSLFVLPFLISMTAFGQQGGAAPNPRPAPKNLKLLAPNTEIRFVMQSFTKALGVECSYCHVQGDFASDDNPKKETARKMIAMVRQIDASFPSSAGVYPAGYHEVDCSTCHRGSVKPETKAPHEFINRAESLGQIVPNNAPGVNLKVLPPDTRVHGDGSIMHDFRDALNVDCGFCHGGGKPYDTDVNPRKDIARGMITLVRKVNANFPGTGVFPVGPQAVTCYTCHRGDTHPVTVSNASYDPPAKK